MIDRGGNARHRAAVAARLAALIVLQALCATAWPQDRAAAPAEDQHTKQEKIFRSQGKDIPPGYITTRSLASYTELLPSGFGSALKQLGPRERWLDIGAGGGQAILDYYAPGYGADNDGKGARPGSKARAVGISIEDRRTGQWHERAASLDGDRIRYLFGKRLREYSTAELGKFRLITDVYGGFSYTEDLSRFVERVLDALEVNGSFYTMVQSVHLEDGRDSPRTWYLTEITDTLGQDVTVCNWLKNVACATVACESKSTWDAPTELIHVRKVCDKPRVPHLKLMKYEAGNPPERHFRLTP